MRAFDLLLSATIVLTASTWPARAEFYLFNVVADAMALSPATNNLGSFTFDATGDGFSYGYVQRKADGSLIHDRFGFDPPNVDVFLSFVTLAKSVSQESRISFGPLGQISGTMSVVRKSGDLLGSYTIKSTPVGTLTGQFGIVRFNGIVEEKTSGAYQGQLYGVGNPFGAPQVIGINPGSNDDYVGTQAGKDFKFSLYPNASGTQPANSVIFASYTGGSWNWFRGVFARVLNPGGSLGMTVEASTGLGKPWIPLVTFPVASTNASSIYRLRLQQ